MTASAGSAASGLGATEAAAADALADASDEAAAVADGAAAEAPVLGAADGVDDEQARKLRSFFPSLAVAVDLAHIGSRDPARDAFRLGKRDVVFVRIDDPEIFGSDVRARHRAFPRAFEEDVQRLYCKLNQRRSRRASDEVAPPLEGARLLLFQFQCG